MSRRMKSLALKMGAAVLALSLAACSSGSSSGGGGGGSSTTTYSGTVTANTVSAATVDIFAIDPNTRALTLLGSGMTDANGQFSIAINSSSAALLFQARGGMYTDEATGNMLSLGAGNAPSNLDDARVRTLECLIGSGSTLTTININPLTTIIARRVGELAKSNPSAVDAASVAMTTDIIGQEFGFPAGTDVRALVAIDLTNAANMAQVSGNPGDPAALLGALLAGLSQQAQGLGLGDPMDLIGALAEDFSDGVFNGAAAGNGGQSTQVTLNNMPLAADAGSSGLQTALNNFLNGGQNQSGTNSSTGAFVTFGNAIASTDQAPAVNRAPNFDLPAAPSALEDSSSQSFSISNVTAGTPAEDMSQTVSFSVSSSDTSIVPTPTVTGTGATRSVNFSPAADANGTVTLTISAQDTGGTAGGGFDTLVRSLSLTITPVNDEPGFDTPSNQSATTGAGQQSVTIVNVTAGAANESAQNLSFTATSNMTGVVDNPTVSYSTGASTATLNYTPLTAGTATISLFVMDDGGTANGGDDTSATVTFDIVVTAGQGGVNPGDIIINEFLADPNGAVNTDSNGDGTVDGSEDEFVELVNTTSSLIDMSMFTLSDAVGVRHSFPAGTMLPANGSIVIMGGGTITGLNTTPGTTGYVELASAGFLGLNNGGDTITLADAGGTTINEVIYAGGDVFEGVSTNRMVDGDVNAAFVNHGTVAGSAGDVSVGTQVDGAAFGGGAGGNNNPPSFDAVSNVTINEDAGLQSVSLTNIDANDMGQTVAITASSSDTAIIPTVTVTPSGQSSNATRSLEFTPVADANTAGGVVTITVVATDSGPGNNSFQSTFTVTINSVNDEPGFDTPSNQSVAVSAGQQSVTIVNVTAGAANESSQNLSFTATSNMTGVVDNPTVSYSTGASTATLNYTPLTAGTATISLFVMDDGGTANGGDDTSATVTFDIVVTAGQGGGVNPGDIIINEILIDPNVTTGQFAPGFDANGDGSFDSTEDEFVELVNTTSSVIDMSMFTISDAASGGTVRHTFAQGTMLPANGSIVVMGGPTLTGLNTTPGTTGFVVLASTGQLALGNSGDTVTLADDQGTTLDEVVYTTNTDGVTLNRMIDGDGSSPMVDHTSVTGAVGQGSVGTRVDGSAFGASGGNNNPPSFDAIADQTVDEDSGATQVMVMNIDANDAGQMVQVSATSSDPTRISSITVTPSGLSSSTSRTIEFTPVADAVASMGNPVVITVTATDDGGAAPNNTVSMTFNVMITPINDAPSFQTPNNATATVGTGTQTITITNVSAGADNESAQNVVFTATSNMTSVVPNPSVSYTGGSTATLSFDPLANGTATISLFAMDDGGTANNGSDTSATVTFEITVNNGGGQGAGMNDIVINEFLADPNGAVNTDSNGDGTVDGSDDEFVELVNATNNTIDMSNFTLEDGASGGTVRHTFAQGTSLPAGGSIVVMGGPTLTGLNTTAGTTGFVVLASTGSLGLNNGGDTITLRNAGGTIINEVVYSGSSEGVSSNREIDGEATAVFVDHTAVTGAVGNVSVGTRVDGSAFAPVTLTVLGVDSRLESVSRLDPTTGLADAKLAFGLRGFKAITAMAFNPTTGRFYAADATRDLLLDIDPSNGKIVIIGPLGFNNVLAMAYDSSNNILYGVDDSTNSLITISTSMGRGTTVGALSNGFNDPEGLAFDQNGTLYVLDNTDLQLGTVNTSTGEATALPNSLGASFATPRGLAFNSQNNTMYFLEGGQTDTLNSVDLVTGIATAVGPVGFSGMEALDFNASANLLTGFDDDSNRLVTLDAASGAGAGSFFTGFSNITGAAYDESNDRLLVIDGVNNLVSVNVVTGEGTVIGDTSTLLTGLAADNGNDIFYGLNGLGNQVVTVNTSTGAVTALPNAVGGNLFNLKGLAFATSNGMLYAVQDDTTSADLVQIDANTGVGTIVGTISLTGGGSLGTIEGLAFDGATLFGVDSNNQLVSLDLGTAQASIVGLHGFGPSRALAFGNNQLYGANDRGEAFSANASTGAGTGIGSLGFDDIEAIAYDANTNTVYGVDIASVPNVLVRINTQTSVATFIGSLGQGFDSVKGLAFDINSNTLYGSDSVTGTLLTINTSTGEATAVGTFNNGIVDVRSLAYDPNSNTLYGVDENSSSDDLITINTSTGEATVVGEISGFSSVEGLAFDAAGNVLYGVNTNNGSELFTIDTVTAAGVALPQETGLINVFGLAFGR